LNPPTPLPLNRTRISPRGDAEAAEKESTDDERPSLRVSATPREISLLTVPRRPRFLVLACLLAALAAFAPPPSRAASIERAFEAAKTHWAFQPIRRPEPPAVQASDRVRTPVDAFLLARLEAQDLAYAPPADPRTLLRRVAFDLTGLPPTFEEIRDFERDPSPAAYRAAVERLLASPRHGERWGRHWLDVARYADTKDLVLLYGRDAVRPYAYTYRDYVIRALNEDLPFDQFLVDQLAADLVQPAVPPWRLAGLGFLTLGRLFDNNPHDQIDDQIDTVSRGLLGLTVACARCHDHKYDAVTMADYYGLYGVFASTERPTLDPLIEDPAQVPGGPEFEAALAKARQELDDHVDAEFARLTLVLRLRLGDYLVRAATTPPDLTETTQFALSLTPDDFRPSLMLRTRRFLQRRAVPGDRVFGPWASLAALPEDRFARQAPETLAALDPNAFNPLVLRALAATPPTNTATLAQTYADLFRHVFVASTNPAAPPAPDDATAELLAVVTGPDSPVGFPRRDTPNHMSRPEKDRYNGLVLALDKLAAHATNPPPARAMVLDDLPEPYPARIFTRGNPSRPGDPVPRTFLRVLQRERADPFPSPGSGRLDLARAILNPDNPLTPRVVANRIWMHHFGEPLVASPADFGARSDPPTHPDLLDWLADEFRRGGWSWKNLHRAIVLSGAYQQASFPASHPALAAATRADPDNRLLWHYPRRRLDLESMRDSYLQVAGRLDPTMGGRPVDVAGDPLNRRRTVYGLVDRQNLPGLFRAFDFAVPDQCAERRPRTTVPQQALFALNSPFVIEQARALAALPEVATAPDPDAGIQTLFRRVLGRLPEPVETESARRFLAVPPEPEIQLDPWAQLAQVLLAGNEANFVD
jgi:hypothetical protein